MYRSFLAFGIQNVKNDTVITVVAKKSWIKKYHQVASIDGLKPSDIPTLEWTTLGKAAFSRGEFCPLEGLGRRGGLGKLYEEQTKKIAAMQRELERKKAKKGETEADVADWKRTKKEAIKYETATRDRQMLWALRIIDAGERFDDLD